MLHKSHQTCFKVGFLGAGNMSCGIFCGMCKSNAIPASCVYAYDTDQECLKNFEKHGAHACKSNEELAKNCDVIIIAVRPQDAEEALSQLKGSISEKKPLIISIMAGKTTKWIQEKLGNDFCVVRVMPNLPLAVGQGVCLIYAASVADCSHDEWEKVKTIFSSCSIIEKVETEDEIDKLTAISASSPGYLFYFIECLTEAGVRAGISHDLAERLAVYSIAGAGDMSRQYLQKSEGHEKKTPAQLLDMVCSSGGSTEKGIQSMKEHKMVDILTEGIKAAMEQNQQLSHA